MMALDFSWQGVQPYQPPYPVDLLFPGGGNSITALGIRSTAEVGRPQLYWTQFAFVQGIAPVLMFDNHRLYYGDDYIPPYGRLNISWAGQPEDHPLTGEVNISWVTSSSTEEILSVFGGVFAAFGQARIHRTQFASVQGIAPVLMFGNHRLYRGDDYIPPQGLLNISWAGYQEYDPLPGEANFSWVKSSSTEETLSVFGSAFAAFGQAHVRNGCEFVYLSGGESAFAAGKPSIYNLALFVQTWGADSFASGSALVDDRTKWIYPRYIHDAVISDPLAYNWIQEIRHARVDNETAFGKVQIFNRNVYVHPSALHAMTFGTAYIDAEIRSVYQRDSNDWLRTGQAFISFTPILLEPEGIAGSRPSPLAQVSHQIILYPHGWDNAEWLTTILPQRTRSEVTGWDNEAIGWHSLTLNPRDIRPQGSTHLDNFGRTWLYLNNQYAYAESVKGIRNVWQNKEDDALTEWGFRLQVYNLDRQMEPYGIIPPRLGRPSVTLKAVPIRPQGIEPVTEPLWLRRHLVSYAIREYPMSGFSNLQVARTVYVRNLADRADCAGWDNTALGRPLVWMNRQWINRVWLGDGLGFGTAFVAPAVRVLYPFERYPDPPYGVLGIPYAGHYARYVWHKGEDWGAVGVPYLFVHKNIITTKWYKNRNDWGIPAVRNLMPEIRTFGRQTDEWGEALVRLQWRDVPVMADDFLRFGSAWVRDRRSWIRMHGVEFLTVGKGIRILTDGTVFPVTQTIRLYTVDEQTGKYGQGYGIDSLAWGKGRAGAQVVYAGNNYFTVFGNTKAISNVIHVLPGYWPGNWDVTDDNTWVSLKHRKIVIEKGIDRTEQEHMPRVSPHTIWATAETPKQAVSNHHGETFYAVDDKLFPPKGVGSPTLIHSHGWCATHGRQFLEFGQVEVSHKTRRIYPEGRRLNLIGWHRVGDGGIIEQWFPVDGLEWGTAEVRHVPVFDGTLRFSGADQAGFGRALVMNFHRELKVTGLDALAMGSSRGDATIYMPQSLYVGPPKKPPMDGFDSGMVSEKAWISFWRRWIEPLGDDSARLLYEPDEYNKRMRVIRQIPVPQQDRMYPDSADTAFVSFPVLYHKTRYIIPDGNSEQYRKSGGGKPAHTTSGGTAAPVTTGSKPPPIMIGAQGVSSGKVGEIGGG